MLVPATVVAASAAAVAAVTLLAIPFAAAADSGPIHVHLALGSGRLSVSAPTVSATTVGPTRVPLTVTDARGTGAGWTLRLVSARPLTVTSVAVACGPRSTCTVPRATTAARGDVALRAAHDSGMGVMNVVVTVARLDDGPNAAVTFAIS